MECYTYLRNVTDLFSDGKTPYQRRCGQPFKGPKLRGIYFIDPEDTEFKRNPSRTQLLNLSRKNFIALKLKKFSNEINSFFNDDYCIKIWNYVKLIR